MEENTGKSVFETLNAVNVNEHTEKKNNLTYLSWAWAWAELLKRYPDATYTVYENRDGWCYHTDGRTAWVKTGVTVCGKEHIEMLPVMDARNRSIPLESVTSMDVNKAIQRSLTKAVARHGLGLYVYAGEDLPECESAEAVTDPQDEEEKTYNRQIVIGLGEAMGRDEQKTVAFAEALVAKAVGKKVAFAEMSLEQLKAVKLEMLKRQKQQESIEVGSDVRQAG